MLQKLKRFLIPLLIIAVAIAVFIYMKQTKPQAKQVEIKEKVWLVETIAANFETLAPVQTLYGTVESNALVSAAAPVSGVIEKVSVLEGQEVEKGEPLVALSQADLAIPLAQARADYENAKAQLALQKLTNKANLEKLQHEEQVLELKKIAVTRTKELMQKNLASKSSLDAANEALVRQEYTVVGARLAVQENTMRLTQAQASFAKAQAALEQAKLNKQRGELVAPYAARIAKVHVSEGSRVNAGSTMVEFYALDSLELRAKLPVSESPQVQTALNSKQVLNGYYQTAQGVQAMPLLRLAGEASTSGLDAFFALPPALSEKRPGELMEIKLKGIAQDQVTAVPYSAIYGNDRIYLVEDERLKAQTVKLVGEVMRDGKLWALLQGDFANGAKISVTHLPNATTGLKVLEDNN